MNKKMRRGLENRPLLYWLVREKIVNKQRRLLSSAILMAEYNPTSANVQEPDEC
jgi:hypothetical protein